MPDISHQFPVVERERQRLKELLKAGCIPSQYDTPEAYFGDMLYDFAWTPDACIRQLKILLQDKEWVSLAAQVKDMMDIDFDYMVRKAIRDQIHAVERLIKSRAERGDWKDWVDSLRPVMQH